MSGDKKQLEPSDLSFNESIKPTCVALSQKTEVEEAKGREIEVVNMVMGTAEGQIFVFDPILRGRGQDIKRYIFDKDTKMQQVDLV